MTWRNAIHLMSDLDGFMEARDPFYLPARTRERSSFGVAAGFFATPIIMAIVLGRVPAGVAPSLMMFLFAGCFFVSGLRARAYRLKRTRAVAQLRAGAAKHLEEWDTP